MAPKLDPKKQDPEIKRLIQNMTPLICGCKYGITTKELIRDIKVAYKQFYQIDVVRFPCLDKYNYREVEDLLLYHPEINKVVFETQCEDGVFRWRLKDASKMEHIFNLGLS